MEFYPTPTLHRFSAGVLKGPKCEIFESGDFAQIRPIWIGDLGTRPKNINFDGLGLKIAILCLLALSPTTLKNFKRCRLVRLKIVSAVA